MTHGDPTRTRRYDALFRAHHAEIAAYCSRRSSSASDAQDAVAEVFLTAWRRLDDVPADSARAWLFATAGRVLANQRRAGRCREALHDRLAGERPSETDAATTAASAGLSGTATVEITHDGRPWAGRRLQWNGADLSVVETTERPGHPRRESRVIDGTLYGIEPADGGWVDLGSPDSIDPGSGTTPGELAAATREDLSGETLRRITAGMTGLRTSQSSEGSTTYSGTVAAGLIATGSGAKEGQAIRVFPYGYVAHGEAADPAALLDVAVTVGPDDTIRQLSVAWGTPSSPWTYTVAYTGLGTTAAPTAPADAKPFPKRSPAG